MKRGEVWLVRLDPGAAGENDARPCLVVSPPEIHDHLPVVLVAPMTTAGLPAPYRIAVAFSGQHGLVLLEQVRAVDKQRLVRRVGAVKRETLSAALATLRELFAESGDVRD
jgi:mRNA interferase MazF